MKPKTAREIIEEPVIDIPSTPVEEPKEETQPAEQPAKEPEADTKKDKTITINERGLVQAANHAELLAYCGAMVTSAMVPERFKTKTELFGALMFTRSVGLPDTAIRQVAVIHGTPALFGDLPLALAQKDNSLQKFKEQWFDKEYKVICFENKNLDSEAYGAVCFGARGKDEEAQSFSFTMDDARKAQLYPAKDRNGNDSPKSPWMKYTKIMLRYKARSIMLKSLFADKINGVAIGEYDFDEHFENVKDVTPASRERSANLKDTFSDDAEAKQEQK